MNLAGKVAIVTGAARGIGRGIALELAKEKMKIAVVDLDKTQMDPVVQEIKGLNTETLAIEADVSSAQATQYMARETIDAFGQIDVLVNNAGVIVVGPCTEETEENWDRILNINLKGTFLCCKAVMPHMIQRTSGRIVNIASVAGKTSHPLILAYSVSKHGVIGLTQALSQGLGEYNITVNAVCPGIIETAMWTDHLNPAFSPIMNVEPSQVVGSFCKESAPLQRPQTAEDIGQAVAFLCKADNISGVALNVDGGYMPI